MLSSRFAGIPISSSTIDGPGVPQLLNRGEQTMRAVTGSGGRVHFGMVADIRSESLAGLRRNSQFAAPFVWRCLSGSAVDPFPHPPHRTGRADFPHPALGQDLTPSSTARGAQAGSDVRARVPVEVREWRAPALASPDVVLEAQPPAQPHRRVSIERPIRIAESAYREVVRPSAQRAVHFAYQRRGLLPCA
jgi:hypothetical protein